MASPTLQNDQASQWQGRIVSHVDFATRLAECRAASSEPDLPRNAGNRRTESKRALLAALNKLGADW
ncbi:hypothetical protein [Sphingomonas endophytica]|uniref:hypothetical protein n=1 Tax=Sphingomonas endophytica TaxID=869719 RepID=UPI00161DC5A0|nr:hypothetical protein [Sphingomonas endophytica]